MWFFHVWICYIWIIHVWILPMWRDGETPDLRSKRHFPTREYWNMASPSKAAYSERNCRKSTFILTVNCPVHPPIRGKENRLPHKPIGSAIGTGGLDFLIAYALMILCHSLFEVVVEQTLYVIHAADVCQLQQLTDLLSTGVFFLGAILSGHMLNLLFDASILHHPGGLHKAWDSLSCHAALQDTITSLWVCA